MINFILKTADFRSGVIWQPDHELGIVVLSNLSTADPSKYMV